MFLLGRGCWCGHRPPERRPAHRAHPLTSTPEHCAGPLLRPTIIRIGQPALAQPATLLEREHELERIVVALRAAGRQAGEAVVIEGAAGMGKSRLLEEARARASDLGLRVLGARATELEQGFPFGVVRQLFERPLLEADSAEREGWLSGAAALAADVLIGAPRRPPRRRRRVQPRAIPAMPCITASTGWPRTSPPIRRSPSSSTTCSGVTRRRCEPSRSSRAGSRGCRSRSFSRRGRSIPRSLPRLRRSSAIPPPKCWSSPR